MESAAFTILLLLQQLLPLGHTGRLERLQAAPSEIRWIPAGTFVRGSRPSDLLYATTLCNRTSPTICQALALQAETPPRVVRTSAFGIGRWEVTNAQWAACVRAGACHPRLGHHPDPRLDAPTLPVTDVTWSDARRYCRWRGGRLPTEAEWERAARGPHGRRFPWGNLWNTHLANHGTGGLPMTDESDRFRRAAPVGSYPEAVSPYGLHDMAGNVWEWVEDWYDESAYIDPDSLIDPTGPSTGAFRVIRGGSWASPPVALRTTMRGHASPDARAIDVGFRCAWDRRP